MPYRVRGIATLRYTDEEMTTAALTSDGKRVEGWVMAPAGKVWEPHDRDPLLWLPPSATKSTDIDQAGSIVNVTWDPGETMAFVEAEMNKHERYLDVLRGKVRSGALKLTAFLAKMLGIAFDEDGVELQPRVETPTVAYRSMAATVKAIEEGRRMAGMPPEDEDRIKTIAHAAAERYAATGDMTDAVNSIMQGIRRAAPIDPDTRLPVIR